MKHTGKVLKKYGNLKIKDCTKCKFIHIVPLPSKKEISKLYKKQYYTKIKPHYIRKYEREIDYWNLIFDEKLDYLETKIKRKTKSKVMAKYYLNDDSPDMEKLGLDYSSEEDMIRKFRFSLAIFSRKAVNLSHLRQTVISFSK